MPMVLPQGMEKRTKCYACSRGHGMFPSLDKTKCVGLLAHVREVRASNAAAVAASSDALLTGGGGRGGGRGLGAYLVSFKLYIVASIVVMSSAYMALGWYLRARDRGYRDALVAVPPSDQTSSETFEFVSKGMVGASGSTAPGSTFEA